MGLIMLKLFLYLSISFILVSESLVSEKEKKTKIYMLNVYNDNIFYFFFFSLGTHKGLVCFITTSAIISYILLTTIQSILNTGMQSINMCHTEALERKKQQTKELVIKLAAQNAYNLASGKKYYYLNPIFPAACALNNRINLQERFNVIINKSQDHVFHVFNPKVSYKSNNITVRSSIVIILYKIIVYFSCSF